MIRAGIARNCGPPAGPRRPHPLTAAVRACPQPRARPGRPVV